MKVQIRKFSQNLPCPLSRAGLQSLQVHLGFVVHLLVHHLQENY